MGRVTGQRSMRCYALAAGCCRCRCCCCCCRIYNTGPVKRSLPLPFATHLASVSSLHSSTPRTMDPHTLRASSVSSRLDPLGARAGNPVNNRRAHAEPLSDPAALLGQHLDRLVNNNCIGTNGSHSPMRSLDETLDLLDGLNCEVNTAILRITVELRSLIF